MDRQDRLPVWFQKWDFNLIGEWALERWEAQVQSDSPLNWLRTKSLHCNIRYRTHLSDHFHKSSLCIYCDLPGDFCRSRLSKQLLILPSPMMSCHWTLLIIFTGPHTCCSNQYKLGDSYYVIQSQITMKKTNQNCMMQTCQHGPTPQCWSWGWPPLP